MQAKKESPDAVRGSIKRMSNEELLQNTRGIIEELLKNIAHSSGIDFERLNLTAIEVDIRLKEENIFDPVDLKSCICTMSNVNYVYGCENQWYVKCFSCQRVIHLCSTRREAAIKWNKQISIKDQLFKGV